MIMLLSVLDPSLVFYKFEDFQYQRPHCLGRFLSLSTHRKTLREYGQQMAITSPLAIKICESFPWHSEFNRIPELRDVRSFIYDDLNKAKFIDPKTAEAISMEPGNILCHYVETAEVDSLFKELIYGCLDDLITREFTPQIATWESDNLYDSIVSITITIQDPDVEPNTQIYNLPLVWDDVSWAKQLKTRDWWPNVHRCVELLSRTDPGLRNYHGAREEPISFEVTEMFLKSLEDYCNTVYLKNSLIKALTKKVYGILDASLGDELIGNIGRFRVTSFWRVHYSFTEGKIVLDKFGPHRMDDID